MGYSLQEQRFDTYEPETTFLMRRILREGDIFIDVGANIGYFTAIGAALVGKTGEVHSFEPAPFIFSYLKKLALKNPNYKIVPNQCAAGDKIGTFKMSYSDFLSGDNTFMPVFYSRITFPKEE